MPTPRGGAATVTIDHKIYVVGGLSEEGRVNTVEVYDTKTDTWDKIEDLPFDKAIRENYLYAGAIGKKIYVVGFGASSYYAYTYSYDLETKKWEKKI